MFRPSDVVSATGAQVHVKVRIPTKLKPDERALVEELKDMQDKRGKDKSGSGWPFGGRK